MLPTTATHNTKKDSVECRDFEKVVCEIFSKKKDHGIVDVTEAFTPLGGSHGQGGAIRSRAVLIAIGVDLDGRRQILGVELEFGMKGERRVRLTLEVPQERWSRLFGQEIAFC